MKVFFTPRVQKPKGSVASLPAPPDQGAEEPFCVLGQAEKAATR